MLNIGACAGEEIVEADDFRARWQQAFAEVRAEEPRVADYDNALSKCSYGLFGHPRIGQI